MVTQRQRKFLMHSCLSAAPRAGWLEAEFFLLFFAMEIAG